jgi:hypothetical protein
VPITSNYEEITFWENIIKISNDDTITGENILALKTNIEMRLGSKLLLGTNYFGRQSVD